MEQSPGAHFHRVRRHQALSAAAAQCCTQRFRSCGRTNCHRPVEVAHLFNPAFCALVIREAVLGFQDKSPSGMPFPLFFLLLPIVLHKRTRLLLPSNVGTKMHPWLQANQEVRIRFADRCIALLPDSREAIVFAASRGFLGITAGRIVARRIPLSLPWPAGSEPELCIKKARFLGRWMALAGSITTIFAMWGVRP